VHALGSTELLKGGAGKEEANTSRKRLGVQLLALALAPPAWADVVEHPATVLTPSRLRP
jgi:hypothetical protein